MWQILQTSNSRWSRIQKTTSKYNGSWIKESASVGLYWTVTGLHIMPPNPHQFVFFNHSCLCNEACSCSPHQVISPGSEYVNRQRSWSNGSSHSLQTPKLKSQQKAGTSAPPTPLNLSPCLTPNLSRNGSKLSSILGGDINQEKSDDICIVVTDAEPSKSPCPWGGSDKGASGDMWTANFIPITEQEQNSSTKRPSTPGKNPCLKQLELLKMLNCVKDYQDNF